MLRIPIRVWAGGLLSIVTAALSGLSCAGADDSEGGPIDDGRGLVRARFELGPAPMAWGSIPWPDDLYLDDGHVAVKELPFESNERQELTQQALASIDGASTRPTIVFAFDGEIDGDSLPASHAASLAPEASVFLIDADASSPEAYDRIPVVVELARDRRSIRARVAFDRALTPGRRYAAVVTDAVRARGSRRRVAPPRSLERILNSSMPLANASEQQARAQYLPLLPALEADGLPRSHIVAIASFRVQSADRDLDHARASFGVAESERAPTFSRVIMGPALDDALGEPPAAGSGAVLGQGVAHQHLFALAHLTIETPRFARVAEGERDAFERDDAGVPRQRGEHEVTCSLIVPRWADSAPLPVVLFQHGIFGERSDALPMANDLAASGYAVLTCDAPLHGSRLIASDEGNRFTGDQEPDGFGDMIGDLLGREPGAGELPPAHPFYYRDAVQQAVIDWMAIVAALRAGSWDERLRDALGRPDAALARSNIGFIGVDIGAEIGVALVAREPELSAAVLAFAGGRALDDWAAGPDYAPLREAYEDVLAGDDEQGFEAAFRGDVGTLRALLDPATGLAHASRLRRSSTNLLMYIAAQDELVPRKSSEALAYGVGAELVDGEPQYELELGEAIALPGMGIEGNVSLARGSVTRVAQSLSPATRSALFTSTGIARFEHPLDPDEPTALERPRLVSNPTAAVMRQVVFFFESHRRCRDAELEPDVPCAASVSALKLDD